MRLVEYHCFVSTSPTFFVKDRYNKHGEQGGFFLSTKSSWYKSIDESKLVEHHCLYCAPSTCFGWDSDNKHGEQEGSQRNSTHK